VRRLASRAGPIERRTVDVPPGPSPWLPIGKRQIPETSVWLLADRRRPSRASRAPSSAGSSESSLGGAPGTKFANREGQAPRREPSDDGFGGSREAPLGRGLPHARGEELPGPELRVPLPAGSCPGSKERPACGSVRRGPGWRSPESRAAELPRAILPAPPLSSQRSRPWPITQYRTRSSSPGSKRSH